MDIVDREIEQIIARQQEQISNEIGKLDERKVTLTNDKTSIQKAKKLAKKLNINFGSALSLDYWREELLTIFSKYTTGIILSTAERKRVAQLSKLIKLSAGQRGLDFCSSQLRWDAQQEFRSCWDTQDSWKRKKIKWDDCLDEDEE
ncbi:MAG: hypothetical protein ACYTXE_35075 [Nostoc sp.]